MNNDFLENFSNEIHEIIGDDNFNLITDKMADLRNESSLIEIKLKNQENTISNLQKEKGRLIEANANLLQSLPITKTSEKEIEKEDTKKFSFKDAFDEKGNFKK